MHCILSVAATIGRASGFATNLMYIEISKSYWEKPKLAYLIPNAEKSLTNLNWMAK